MRRYILRVDFFVLFLLVAWSGVFGQSDQADTTNYQLDDVVITGQHAPVRAEKSTHRIQIIDRKRIELQAANTLDDLMRSELSTQLFQDPVLGSVMQLQGVSGENVKILVDGVPVVGRLGGELDLSQLPLNQVERIEVVEGPMSVEYGTNALAGVINLITKKESAETWELNLTGYEANAGKGVSLYEGFHNYSGDLFFKKGPHQFRLSGGRFFFGGRFEDAGVRPPLWNPKRQAFGSGSYGWQKNDLNLRLTGDVFDELLILKGGISGTYRPFAIDELYQTRRANLRAFADRSLGIHTSLNILAGYSVYQRDKTVQRTDLNTLGETMISSLANQDGFDAFMSRGTLNHHPGKSLSLQAGYDINLETASGGKIQSGVQSIQDYAFFASGEYHLKERAVVRPGLRMAWNSRYQAPLAPSLHLKFQVSPEWTLRTSYARGFRAPSLRELFFEFIDINHNITGNPELKAEYSHNLQLSANWKQLKGETLWKAEIATFYNTIQDKIDLAFTGVSDISLTYFNLDVLNTFGAQTQLHWQKGNLRLSAGGAMLARQSLFENLTESIPVNYSFNGTFRFNLRIPRQQLSLVGFYKYNGPVQGFRNLGDETSPELVPTRIAGYHLADITLTRTWWQGRISSAIGVKNLLNVTNVAATQAGGAHSGGGEGTAIALGRNIFLRLNLKLSKS